MTEAEDTGNLKTQKGYVAPCGRIASEGAMDPWQRQAT